jgi:hypothetical protein
MECQRLQNAGRSDSKPGGLHGRGLAAAWPTRMPTDPTLWRCTHYTPLRIHRRPHTAKQARKDAISGAEARSEGWCSPVEANGSHKDRQQGKKKVASNGIPARVGKKVVDRRPELHTAWEWTTQH